MQSFRAHRGPVFAACMAGRERVMTSGADPLIVQFELTTDRPESDAEKKWVMTTARSKHTHDVRALLSIGQSIVSAGTFFRCISGQLFSVYKFCSPVL